MARFLVSNVFQVVGRGRGVTGQIVDGSIAMGIVLRQEDTATPMEWRVIGIGSVSRMEESNVALILENAPELDDLRRLLPPGSALVGDSLEGRGSKLLDDLRKTLDGIKSPPDNRYLAWPIPSGVDHDIAALVNQFVRGDAALREELMRSLTSPQVDRLIGFGIRMAILAVREQSVARLRLGLLAAALGGSSRQSDWRDVASDMPPFEDAGMRIRRDSRPAFLEAASIANSRTAMLIRIASPGRHAWLRWVKRLKIRRLGQWRAVEAPDGFRYVVRNPMSEAELIEMFETAIAREKSKRRS